MLFHAKNNTAKWKGRNLFSIFTQCYVTDCICEKTFGLGTFVASNFPTEINSNRNNLNRQKSIFKANAAILRVLIQQKGNICILAFTKSNNIITATT